MTLAPAPTMSIALTAPALPLGVSQFPVLCNAVFLGLFAQSQLPLGGYLGFTLTWDTILTTQGPLPVARAATFILTTDSAVFSISL